MSGIHTYSPSKKEKDRLDFIQPLENFAFRLWDLQYMYTPSGFFLCRHGIERYANRLGKINFVLPFGKSPGLLRTRIVNLLGADIDDKSETNKEDYVAALDIFLRSIMDCPKYTVIPDYHYSQRNRSKAETEKWMRETAEITGASSGVKAYFEGVPKEDIVLDNTDIRINPFTNPWHPEWEDAECREKFVAGINALREQGKFWDGTNIDF